ncbi:rab-GTPase-TBC domain-containing protein [Paraphysoderma sedebokerense]|nr:rab-GTPase-TBC domain-containing protein [Paraphysoderma sedebokerense]
MPPIQRRNTESDKRTNNKSDSVDGNSSPLEEEINKPLHESDFKRHTDEPASLPSRSKRIKVIKEAIKSKYIGELREIGINEGFVNDELRKSAWPIVLFGSEDGFPLSPSKEDDDKSEGKNGHADRGLRHRKSKTVETNADDSDEDPSSSPVESHPYSRQVALDVQRSMSIIPISYSESERKQRLIELSSVIHYVLARNPFLHYYQGFHDICAVLLLTLGESKASMVAERLALLYLRDAMHSKLEPTMQQILFILPILKQEDEALFQLFERVSLQPYFCLSWVIAWLAHDIKELGLVSRIFDFFICSNPMMPVYFSAAIVLSRRSQLFEVDEDYSTIHTSLCDIQETTEKEVGAWVQLSRDLYAKYSIEALEEYTGWKLPETSCPRTWNSNIISDSSLLVVPDKDVLREYMEDNAVVSNSLPDPYVFGNDRSIRPVDRTGLHSVSRWKTLPKNIIITALMATSVWVILGTEGVADWTEHISLYVQEFTEWAVGPVMI